MPHDRLLCHRLRGRCVRPHADRPGLRLPGTIGGPSRSFFVWGVELRMKWSTRSASAPAGGRPLRSPLPTRAQRVELRSRIGMQPGGVCYARLHELLLSLIRRPSRRMNPSSRGIELSRTSVSHMNSPARRFRRHRGPALFGFPNTDAGTQPDILAAVYRSVSASSSARARANLAALWFENCLLYCTPLPSEALPEVKVAGMWRVRYPGGTDCKA
jgi:hypothetical protein